MIMETSWIVIYEAWKKKLAVFCDCKIVAYVDVENYADILKQAAEHFDIEVTFAPSAISEISKLF